MKSWRDTLIACALLRDAAREAERAVPVPVVLVPAALLEHWEAQRTLWHVCHRFMNKVAA